MSKRSILWQPEPAVMQETRTIASDLASSLVNTPGLIGESPTMQAIKAAIERIAPADSHTLITGETGTGKELVAGLLHRYSLRQTKPFVCINCAALPNDLVESELFGYERGAFTGAHTRKEGQLQRAAGGTIFFDEIGDMSVCAQAKVLRAIENKEVQRLGGTSGAPVDMRVVAATNGNLEQLVTEGKFRADLYFRLNVARIHLPPLRDRKEDIPALCAHYIRIMSRRFGRQVEGLTAAALDTLLRYDWPGNVRELKNLIEAIFINLPLQQIRLVDLPEQFRRRLVETAALPQDERTRMLGVLFATNWNVSKAAQQLHWSRMTVYRKLAHYRMVRGGEGTKRGDFVGRALPALTEEDSHISHPLVV